VAPPPGFKSPVALPPGFKRGDDLGGVKGVVTPPPGFKNPVNPPPGFTPNSQANLNEENNQDKNARTG